MIVPVLSSTIISILAAVSSSSAVLNKSPCLAPFPLPTMIATGVASPNAHGHEMTRTDIARARIKPISLPAIAHAIAVAIAMPMTAGTNTPETLSAIFAMGALVAAESSTSLMI